VGWKRRSHTFFSSEPWTETDKKQFIKQKERNLRLAKSYFVLLYFGCRVNGSLTTMPLPSFITRFFLDKDTDVAEKLNTTNLIICPERILNAP